MYPDCEPILCMQVARLGVMFVALNGRIVDVQHFLSCRALSGWLGGGGGGGGADGDGGAVLTLHKFEPLESALQECVHNCVCGTQCSITWLHSQRASLHRMRYACGTHAVRMHLRMHYVCICVPQAEEAAEDANNVRERVEGKPLVRHKHAHARANRLVRRLVKRAVPVAPPLATLASQGWFTRLLAALRTGTSL